MIRQRCQDFLTENTLESPIVQRVKAFQTKRKRKTWRSENGVVRGAKSATRRLKIGWKHKFKGSFSLISAGKGGGTHEFDAPINYSLNELTENISNLYFPNGINQTQSIRLSDVQSYLANFSGEQLSELVGDNPFTVENFYKSRKTYPIRVYLHTYNADKEGAVSTATVHTTEDEQLDANGQEQITLEIPEYSPHFQMIPDEESDGDLPTLFDSGTPTITFSTRRQENERELTNQQVNAANPNDMRETSHQSSHHGIEDDGRCPNESQCTEESLNHILTRLTQQIEDQRTNTVNVSRFEVLPGGMRAFKRKSFDPKSKLSVKFVGELGIDEGGPTREFLRLVMVELSQMPIFCGPPHSKLLDLHQPALQDNTYETVGRMMAFSIVHGGPTPSFLHPLLYQAIVHGITTVHPTEEDIMDQGYREQIKSLLHAEDMTPYEDLIQMAGCFALAQRLDQRKELCDAIVKFLVFGRLYECFEQFCEGLATLDVLKEVRAHGERMREVFVHEETTLDVATVELVFEVQLSDVNSNQRRSEEIVLTNWRDLLLDLEDSEEPSLKDLLIFATGADSIPPLGFHPTPSLRFHIPTTHKPEDKSNFPFANTCANVLSIPLLENYDKFKLNMTAACGILQFTTE